MPEPPSVLNIHTPTSSFAIVHSLTQETLLNLFDKLSRKHNTDYYGQRVGPGWLKYEYNDGIWNLDDDSDYTIFTWRHQQQTQADNSLDDEASPPTIHGSPALSYTLTPPALVASTSKVQLSDVPSAPTRGGGPGGGFYPPTSNKKPNPGASTTASPTTPTLHLADPSKPLPTPPAYLNPSFYAFNPARRGVPKVSASSGPSRVPSRASTRKSGKGSHHSGLGSGIDEDAGIPKLKKEFEKFHSENGVRTVMGSIGPVQNVRMLLKVGYRHVYISRKFAIKHGFIPRDASPGNYGYGGLVNIGSWPITLVPSSSQPGHVDIPGVGRLAPTSSSIRKGSQHRETLKTAHDGGSMISLSQNPPQRRRTASETPSTSSHHLHPRRHRQPTSNSSVPPQSQSQPASRPQGHTVTIQVYLSEEPHFDVVLGRSFFEKRQVKTSSIDPTDVVCLDTGEKIECELVILKDGRGEIVTVT